MISAWAIVAILLMATKASKFSSNQPFSLELCLCFSLDDIGMEIVESLTEDIVELFYLCRRRLQNEIVAGLNNMRSLEKGNGWLEG